jgi:hypothetical protein
MHLFLSGSQSSSPFKLQVDAIFSLTNDATNNVISAKWNDADLGKSGILVSNDLIAGIKKGLVDGTITLHDDGKNLELNIALVLKNIELDLKNVQPEILNEVIHKTLAEIPLLTMDVKVKISKDKTDLELKTSLLELFKARFDALLKEKLAELEKRIRSELSARLQEALGPLEKQLTSLGLPTSIAEAEAKVNAGKQLAESKKQELEAEKNRLQAKADEEKNRLLRQAEEEKRKQTEALKAKIPGDGNLPNVPKLPF